MSTFLSLVNRVNRRVNEVELTSSNFASADGFYATAKDAVNDALFRIDQHQFQWPWNHSTHTETLVAGTNRYDFPANTKLIDFDSFRVQRNDTFGNETQYLAKKDYEEYLKSYADVEYNTTDTSIRQLPRYVAQSQSMDYVVYPVPDEAYDLDFELYSLATELTAHGDTTLVPDNFDNVITNGAMEFVYDFRGDLDTSQKFARKFEDGINEMRTIYINRQSAVKDTRLPSRSGRAPTHVRI